MTFRKKSYVNQMLRYNPHFEKYVEMSRAQQVDLVKGLFEDIEDEIAYCRTDSIRLINFLIDEIPRFVQELDAKGFWRMDPKYLASTYPEVLLSSDLPIKHLRSAINEKAKNTPLKFYIRDTEEITSGFFALASYFSGTHSIYLPISYEKIFEKGDFAQNTKIARLKEVLKKETQMSVLIHEIQHARDTVEIEHVQDTNDILLQDQMISDFKDLYNQKVLDSLDSPVTPIDYIFNDAMEPSSITKILEADFQIFLDQIANNRQSVLSSIEKIKKEIEKESGFWSKIENTFFLTNKQSSFDTKSLNLALLKSGHKAPKATINKKQGVESSLNKETSDTFKQLKNPDIYTSIQNQVLDAIREYPKQPETNNSSQKELQAIENAFRSCSQSIRFSNGGSIPHDFVGFFQVEGIDFAKRVATHTLLDFCFYLSKALYVETFDKTSIDPTLTGVLDFKEDYPLAFILRHSELYSYRTEEVDATISDAILGLDLETARHFHGSQFYRYALTKFKNIFEALPDQFHFIDQQIPRMSVLTDIFVQKALEDLFNQIFKIDFKLVEGTFFDFTSEIQGCSYADLNTDKSRIIVKGKSIDVESVKSEIVELFISRFIEPFFSQNKTEVLMKFLSDNIFAASIHGIFISTVLRKNEELISGTLYETFMSYPMIKEAVDSIKNIFEKVKKIRDPLWHSLSFSEKYISTSRTLLIYIFQKNMFDKYGQIAKHSLNMSEVVKLYTIKDKQVQIFKGISNQTVDACLDFLKSKVDALKVDISEFFQAVRSFYDLCVSDYINMHPNKANAQAYADSLAEIQDIWIKKVKQAYETNLTGTKSCKDSHSIAFLKALSPLIDFFYDNTIGLVFTSDHFKDYISQPSESNILNFEKLIEAKHAVTKGNFRDLHFLKISRLIVSYKVFASDPIRARIEDAEICKSIYNNNNIGFLFSETIESILYVLRDADLVPNHSKLEILLGLMSYNLAMLTLSQFFVDHMDF